MKLFTNKTKTEANNIELISNYVLSFSELSCIRGGDSGEEDNGLKVDD